MLMYQGQLVSKKEKDRIIFVIEHQSNEVSELSGPDMTISEILISTSPKYCMVNFAQNISQVGYDAAAFWSGRRREVTARKLADLRQISPKLAQRTIDATTQLCIRSADIPSLSRRFKSNDQMLRYPRINVIVFTDIFFAKKKTLTSTRGNTCCQVFVPEHNYVIVKPMASRKSGFPKALKSFFKDEGLPPAIVTDGSKEKVQGESLKLCHQVGCELRELEQGTPYSNCAERYMGILKEKVPREMKRTKSPMKLWDYCVEWSANVLSSIAHDHYQLQGMTPKTKLTGQLTDISNLCEFGWYEWV